MTKLVAALEAGGYVERTADPLDGRAWLIRATTSGRTLVESSREQRLHGLARRLEALEPEQVEALAGRPAGDRGARGRLTAPGRSAAYRRAGCTIEKQRDRFTSQRPG